MTDTEIQAIADTIVRKFNPEKIVLFGSHAAGTAGPDSDVDILVVLPFEGPPYQTAAQIRIALPLTVSFDIIARTPAQIESQSGGPITTAALATGRVLFQRAA
ncbi:MAG: nucleotidyltransferase domain-containing protein [Phycisphaeraceae bacterium]|nr:nucleotidyltransferase domain-containing protein [Phycisphaeraceae bacterium]